MQPLNQLILGDNLEILKGLPDESVDLIYLDPPFFSNRNYEVIWGDEGEVRSFRDRWSGGMDHYIAWLKERVEQMHRILKPTGSIFLHCDWHANAYIRVDILDKIFGMGHLRGEIVWQRAQAHNDAKKKLSVLSDTIWYYSKGDVATFNAVYTDLAEVSKSSFNLEDDRGKYYYIVLTAPNVRKGESGTEWKGYNPTSIGRSWAVPNIIIDELVGVEERKRMGVLEKLDLLFEKGYIAFSKNNVPRVKKYLDQSKGALVGNIWTDLLFSSNSKERIGYPTQKPEALLQRIIEMASNKGDVVLDPFVGGGTTVIAAEKLERNWIGIDQSVQAIKVTEFRMNVVQGGGNASQTNIFSSFTVKLHKYDYDTLRNRDAFDFESWIIEQYGGHPQNKKGGDRGIDGKAADGAPIQVKRSDNIGRVVIDNFPTAAERLDATRYNKAIKEGQPIGHIIAFSFGKGAIEEVARLKNDKNIIIRLVRVEDIVPIAKKPTLSVEAHEAGRDKKGICELSFTATGHSEAGIEFYSWDWDYSEQKGFSPEVIIDKAGHQTIKLKPGTHTIAVKVVDNDGLEGMEVLRLKVNGAVERV